MSVAMQGQMKTVPRDSAPGALVTNASLFHRTILVTVSPRFVFVNGSSDALEIVQTGIVAVQRFMFFTL